MSRTHLVIPDCQVKPGTGLAYLRWIGNYIAKKKPDVVVQIGDFADMPSLSSYDAGKKSHEGMRYKSDIEAATTGMIALMSPIHELQSKQRINKEKIYRPKLYLTLGNHENRINKVVNDDAKLAGTLSTDDLPYARFGWSVSEFLRPIFVDGVSYAHYFTSGPMGRPVGNARQLVLKKLQSCVMGHAQHWDIHRTNRADGRAVIGLFTGSCYLHDEEYLGPQGNHYGRGIWVLHEVRDGDFYPMHVSLSFLAKKYDY